MLSGGELDSSRQCLHSRTDNSTAGANVYGTVCVCVCVCVDGRESHACFPPSHCFSSPLSCASPLSSSALSFSHLLSLPPCLFSSVSSSFSVPSSLSFSSSVSLLAVDVTEAEAEATLPLIGCHSDVTDKEKRGRRGRRRRGEGRK